jgi:hypothetical protein
MTAPPDPLLDMLRTIERSINQARWAEARSTVQHAIIERRREQAPAEVVRVML